MSADRAGAEPGRAWREAPLIFERSRPGRRAGRPPRPDLPVPDLPESLRRARPPRLPELSEPEIVRHFTTLADRTFGVDTGFYPLGSCTMKHNPRVNERLVGLPGFRDLHPHQEEEAAQGALELMWRLQGMLAEIAGLPGVTLQPAAGSQGELTGLMLMRAYFAYRGEERDTIITADTAHGTNPASVTMAGYQLEKVATDARGNLDLDDLRGKVNERTAGLMLTNPSTLGLFDEGIEEIARIFHDVGALLYYDGANLNAVVGISRPGDMGFDIVHYNLHKTFSQPHGGGGPGGGPVAVRDVIEPYLPAPVVVRDGDTFRLDHDRPRSIGRVRGFAGPFGVFVRAYAFMRSYGPGLKEMSETSVLNANYLLARLRDDYDLPYDRHCMHEFVLSARTHGLRDPPADRLLPARRLGGADDRAHRDGAEGAAGRVRARDEGDRPGGGRVAPRSRGRPTRPTGTPPRRGARGEAASPAVPLRRASCSRALRGRIEDPRGPRLRGLLTLVVMDSGRAWW
jgi:glycine dehydrogenase subunit 2